MLKTFSLCLSNRGWVMQAAVGSAHYTALSRNGPQFCSFVMRRDWEQNGTHTSECQSEHLHTVPPPTRGDGFSIAGKDIWMNQCARLKRPLARSAEGRGTGEEGREGKAQEAKGGREGTPAVARVTRGGERKRDFLHKLKYASWRGFGVAALIQRIRVQSCPPPLGCRSSVAGGLLQAEGLGNATYVESGDLFLSA